MLNAFKGLFGFGSNKDSEKKPEEAVVDAANDGDAEVEKEEGFLDHLTTGLEKITDAVSDIAHRLLDANGDGTISHDEIQEAVEKAKAAAEKAAEVIQTLAPLAEKVGIDVPDINISDSKKDKKHDEKGHKGKHHKKKHKKESDHNQESSESIVEAAQHATASFNPMLTHSQNSAGTLNTVNEEIPTVEAVASNVSRERASSSPRP